MEAVNAITTTHNLDFKARPWIRDQRIMEFLVGTCHGQYQVIKGQLVIISIINGVPHNGHLEDVFEWFEFSARSQKVNLIIAEFFNDRFYTHCIEKRGYLPMKGTKSVVKIFARDRRTKHLLRINK